jgi:hypothetical protein
VAVKVSVEPAAVYAVMIPIITADDENVEMIDRNDGAQMIEVVFLEIHGAFDQNPPSYPAQFVFLLARFARWPLTNWSILS